MGIQYNQVNDVTTTLNGAITAGATSITVNSGGSFPAVPFAIRIDSEIMQVTSTGAGTNWTVTRASESVNGAATAASHANGATVFQMATAAAWNALVQLQTSPYATQTGGIAVDSRVNIGSTTLNDIAITGTNDGNFAAISGNNLSTASNASGHGLSGSTASTNASAAAVFGNNVGSGNGGAFANSSTTAPTVKSANSSAGPVFQGTDGAATTTQLNTDGTANLYTSPNYIMNGDMLVNQRFGPAGTLAIASGAQNKYMVDRWHLDKDGTSQGTLSQIAFTVGQTDVPNEPQYYLDWNHSTAGTGGTKDNIQHNIESVRTLAGKQVTFSIYMKVAASTQAVTLEIEQNFGTGGSASVLYTKGSTDTVTTTFQRFSYTVTLTGISGKTLGTAFTDSLIVRVKNPLNAAYQISYAHAQLELGPLATPYRVEDYETTYQKCLRYYQKSFDYSTAPVTNVGSNSGAFRIQQAAAGVFTMLQTLTYQVPLRTAATPTLYSPSSAANEWFNDGIAGVCSGSTAFSPTTKNFQPGCSTRTGSGAGNINSVHWSVDADY